ncbi:phosphatidylserine decarboxylase family protein [Cordyceps militaris CM01]|uniref:Phosphatidylserine decarboxylase family protein n=1 Tax=Cordyceps militaris (strain CM01) TaxID=983644 RepID=G3JTS3_CORMM|nr:phosphatidylserine decarboxylase family protein [Cordyceps militaris CM01]EGX88077.1 phosphatidylserine decarboxylase family protein [Cordyceps militaris CM01]
MSTKLYGLNYPGNPPMSCRHQPAPTRRMLARRTREEEYARQDRTELSRESTVHNACFNTSCKRNPRNVGAAGIPGFAVAAGRIGHVRHTGITIAKLGISRRVARQQSLKFWSLYKDNGSYIKYHEVKEDFEFRKPQTASESNFPMHRLTTKLRPGAWLPADHRIHRQYLAEVIDSVDSGKTAGGALSPALQEFRDLIEGNARIYMYFVQMFDEVPRKQPYLRDPAGHKQVRDYEHMLRVLNHIVTRAPAWTQTEAAMGVVGVPMCAVFDYPMGTPSGHAAFLDPDVNKALKKVLNEWGKYLQTPESAAVLGDHATGWFGETGRHDLLQVANAPYKSSHKFEDMFVCDPSAKHMGFKSWDDFFTRKVHDTARPVASPDDDSVIANACESKIFNVQANAQLRDHFFAKGQRYSLLDMLGHDVLASRFVGGTVYQAFLSALSYHRWHSPVSGVVRRALLVDGTYFSEPLFEGPGDASVEQIDTGGISVAQGYLACMAARAVIVLQADNADLGLVAFVGIGMDEVSTCDITVKEGQRVKKGEELGMFHFGGSTHCLVFQKGVRLEGLPEVGRVENVPVRGKLATVKR